MGRRKKPRAAAPEVHSLLPEPQRATVKLPTYLPVLPPGCEPLDFAPKPLSAETTILAEDAISASFITAEPALSAEECAAWIRWGETEGFATEKHAASAYVAYRDNGRLAVQSPEIAAAIFERLRPLLPHIRGKAASGCNPNVRLYKYDASQRFGRHVDGAQRLDDGSETEFTTLLYLNDGFAGGHTVFYESHAPNGRELLRVAPRRGAVLLHAHGERCLTHEGARVDAGTKYLLRTDVAYG